MELTREQKNAIECTGNMVLTACPGSGKTTVVVEKIAKDIVNLKDFEGVIAISHTKKASSELMDRAKKRMCDIKCSFFGTMDKFYLKEIIHNFLPHLFGRRKDLTLLKVKDLSIEDKETVSFMLAEEYFIPRDDKQALEVILNLYKKGCFVLELSPLLSLYLLENSYACQEYIKKRYKSLYIDEYQDSGFIQHEIFKRMAILGLKSVAVGDVDQSIHEYAMKSSKYLKQLKEGEGGFECYELTYNHRCHHSIVNYASRLINSKCDLIESKDIQMYRVNIEGYFKEIAAWIDSTIEDVKKSFDISCNRKIAVFAVSNKSVSYFSSCLKTKNRIYIEDKLSDIGGDVSRLVKDILQYRFNEDLTAQEIIDEYMKGSLSRREIFELRKIIKSIRTVEEKDVIITIKKIIAELGGHALNESHIVGIEEVLYTDAVRKSYQKMDDDEIQIMNVHKSKGLEFDCVYHLDLYDHVLPKREYITGNFDVVFKNERQCLNLHYVAITRAKKFVVLVTSTQRHNSKGNIVQASPSQFFLREGLGDLYKTL